MKWLNKMVKKQVERELLKLHLGSFVLRVERVADLLELLVKLLEGKIEEEKSKHYTTQWDKEEEDVDKKREEKTLDLETESLSFSETSFDVNSISSRIEREESRNLFDPSHVGSYDDDHDTDMSLESEEEEEEESLRNLCCVEPGIKSQELKCEEKRVQISGTNEEEEMVKEQWKEWMDKQESRGIHVTCTQVKPAAAQNTEIQGEEAKPEVEKQEKKTPKEKSNISKCLKYLSNFSSPLSFHKWERFEDES